MDVRTLSQGFTAIGRAGTLPADSKIVAFGHRAADEYTSLIKDADGPIRSEMFNLGPSLVTKALRRQARAGVPVELTIDRTAAQKSFIDTVRKSGASVETYDAGRVLGREQPECLHSKAIVAGTHGMVSTGTITRFTPQKLELSALLPKDASAALGELIDASRSGEPATVQRTAAAAAKHGIALNDPLSGVHVITREMEHLVDEATKDVDLVTKELDDVAFTQRLVDAKARGVDVRLTVADLADADKALLDEAGIAVRRTPFRGGDMDAQLGHRLHFTSLLRDDATRGYFGSRYPWHAGAGRELGVVVDGALARRTRDAVAEQLDRSTGRIVADRLRQHGRAATATPIRVTATVGGTGGALAGAAALTHRD